MKIDWWPIKAYLIFYLAVLVVSLLTLKFGLLNNLFNETFPQIFANWDGGYFLAIAQTDYTNPIHFAFFPLYPWLIRLGAVITGNSLSSALLINWLAAGSAVYFFYTLAKTELTQANSRRAVVYLLLFPTSFYLLTAYSESLFLLTAVLSFYFLRRQKYTLAGLMAALACTDRIFGLALVAAVIVELWQQKKLAKTWLGLIIMLAGILIYPLYLISIQQPPLAFIAAENHWQRLITAQGLNIFAFLPGLVNGPFWPNGLIQLLDFLALVWAVGLSLRLYRQRRWAYATYAATSVLIILLSGSLMSTSRFILPIFPFFLTLAAWPTRAKFLHIRWSIIYTIISAGLLIFFSTRFFAGYWIS